MSVIFDIEVMRGGKMKEKQKRSRRFYRRIKVRYMLILLALGAGIYIITHQSVRIPINTSGNDVLYYTYDNYNRNVDDPNKGMLMMYDPRTNQHEIIMDSPRQYLISPVGWIAYRNEGRNIIISDVQDVDNIHAIILTLSDESRLLSWSYDGQYLAYTDVNSLGEPSIYLWNGETSINITPDERLAEVTFYLIDRSHFSDSVGGWSADGRFVFTALYQESPSVDPELYLWDGKKTYNLSQNPNGDDRSASWSADGQVAFLSEVDGQYYIKVWDGISLTDNKPRNTGLAVGASDIYYSPSWSPDNRLAYTNEQAIYLWNGKTSDNVSQVYGSAPDFNRNGFLAYSSIDDYGTGLGYLHIRDPYNQTIEILSGYYSAWSKDGYLAYCIGDNLALFDGENMIAITSAVRASIGTWQSGQSIICMNSA